MDALKKRKAAKAHVGINVGHHDASVCVLYPGESGEMEFELYEEERLSKKKRAGFYPYLGLDLLQKKFDVGDLPEDQIAFTTFFTTLKESFDFISKRNNVSKFSSVYNYDLKLTGNNGKALNVVHHEAHLFSVLPLLDPLEEHLVLVADGCGSNAKEFWENSLLKDEYECEERTWETISIYLYKGGKLSTIFKKLSPFYLSSPPFSQYTPAAYFSACAEKVFGHWSHAGKVMGLAGYHEGEIYQPEQLFSLLCGMPEVEERNKAAFDSLSESELREYEKLCASVQLHYESYMGNLLKECLDKVGGKPNLVFAGGCALNCIFNEKLRKSGLFKSVFAPAWPNDEGVSLGAAVANYYFKNGEIPKIKNPKSPFKGAKREYSKETVRKAFRSFECRDFQLEEIAGLLAQDKVVAWVIGRSECGPRALGHRSILCSPFRKGVKDYLNQHVKFREAFRPYGCSVLREEQETYFVGAAGLESPYMSFAPLVKEKWKKPLEEVVHVDDTLRIQTVDEGFGVFYDLLVKLKEITGTSLIVHTSLNVNRQPILESLEDAVKFFENSEVEHLVFEDTLVLKS